MEQVAGALDTLLLWLLLIGLILLRKRSLRVQDEHGVVLPPGQRLRLMAMEWTEPLLEILVVGIVLSDELAQGGAHLVAAAVGAVAGIIVGILRGRFIYVRAEPGLRAVVLRRNVAEYIAIVILIGLTFFTEYAPQRSEFLSLLVTAALVLLVVESISRVIWTTVQFRRAAAEVGVDAG